MYHDAHLPVHSTCLFIDHDSASMTCVCTQHQIMRDWCGYREIDAGVPKEVVLACCGNCLNIDGVSRGKLSVTAQADQGIIYTSVSGRGDCSTRAINPSRTLTSSIISRRSGAHRPSIKNNQELPSLGQSTDSFDATIFYH